MKHIILFILLSIFAVLVFGCTKTDQVTTEENPLSNQSFSFNFNIKTLEDDNDSISIQKGFPYTKLIESLKTIKANINSNEVNEQESNFDSSNEVSQSNSSSNNSTNSTNSNNLENDDKMSMLNDKLNSLGMNLKDVYYNQIILVVSSSSTAKIYCFDCNDGNWSANNSLYAISGFVGKNGVSSNKKEGDNCSPVGMFSLGDAFGILDNPGTSLNYRKVTENSYFVDDPNSSYYNTWVESSDVTWNSAEHLIDNSPNYNYGVVINYNMNPIVPGNGSAIFLHCSSKSTTGCVAVSEANMKSILLWLKPGAGIIIV